MKVTVLGHTKSYANTIFENTHMVCEDADSASNILEVAGRSCYAAFHKPNKATRKRSDYIANLIRAGHTSVLEHGSCSMRFEGVSRSLTHELVRHRVGCSYSQRSQRYVEESDVSNVLPAGLDQYPDLLEEFQAHAARARHLYRRIAQRFTEAGEDRKTARGKARSVLLESTETDLVVTYNYLAWRHFLDRRGSLHADGEIRALAVECYAQLSVIEPDIFQDFGIYIGRQGEYLVKREL